MKTAVAKTRKPSVGALVDQLWAANEEKKRLSKQVDELAKTVSELEEQLAERLNEEGLESAKGAKGSVSFRSSIVPTVNDWDAFWAFVFKKKFSHLLQRRVSAEAYRELMERGIEVPGTTPFTKRSLSLTTVK